MTKTKPTPVDQLSPRHSIDWNGAPCRVVSNLRAEGGKRVLSYRDPFGKVWTVTTGARAVFRRLVA